MKNPFLAICASLALYTALPSAFAGENTGKFEYLALDEPTLLAGAEGQSKGDQLTKALTAKGADGWRLVAVKDSPARFSAPRVIGDKIPTQWTIQSEAFYYFEREKK